MTVKKTTHSCLLGFFLVFNSKKMQMHAMYIFFLLADLSLRKFQDVFIPVLSYNTCLQQKAFPAPSVESC